MSRVVMVAALCLLAAACADDINRSEGPKRQRDRNPPSIGWIDIPANDATVNPTCACRAGRATNRGVKAVRIYFDDELMVSVPLATPVPTCRRRLRAAPLRTTFMISSR
jgi:hypothetical protein